ncbi:MAG: cytochrome c [Roseitalea porphyridii]|jgi:mono/diheme cytochrome c family protein|uniref:c-type cytochrome n=1 Tax=Roseitalea porphyridii TaxID=1852022 RepID=UPI0032EF2DCB
MRGPSWLAAGAAMAAGVAAIVVFWPENADPGALLRPDHAPTVARGEALYEANCASCHGISLKGEPNWQTRRPDGLMPAPPHDETGHTWHHPDRVLFEITKYGVARAANLDGYQSAMQDYEGVLSDAEIIAVLSYIKSTWPAEIRQSHDELNRRYAGRAQ